MASTITEPTYRHNRWADIVSDLLNQAGVAIDGDRPGDITVHDEQFFHRVLQQGSLGLGESYMDGWWDCPRVDVFFFLTGYCVPGWKTACLRT